MVSTNPSVFVFVASLAAIAGAVSPKASGPRLLRLEGTEVTAGLLEPEVGGSVDEAHLPANLTEWAAAWEENMLAEPLTAVRHYSQRVLPASSIEAVKADKNPAESIASALAQKNEYVKLAAGKACPWGTSLATKLQCEAAASKLGLSQASVNLENHGESLPAGCSFAKDALAWANSTSLIHGKYSPICAAPPVFPSTFKSVVGVLSCPTDKYAREVIRKTWMQQPGLCTIDKASGAHDGDGCVVYVVFVIGAAQETNLAIPDEKSDVGGNVAIHLVNDELFLAIPDGKSDVGGHVRMGDVRRKAFEFLHWASHKYPWASHIGRVDQDYFPRFNYVLPAVAEKRNTYQYLGVRMKSDLCTASMQEVHESVSAGRFDIGHNGHPKKGCNCVFGPMYFLSRQLASNITDGTYEFWNDHAHLDDQTLGCVVSEFVRRYKVPVDTFDDIHTDAERMARVEGLRGVDR